MVSQKANAKTPLEKKTLNMDMSHSGPFYIPIVHIVMVLLLPLWRHPGVPHALMLSLARRRVVRLLLLRWRRSHHRRARRREVLLLRIRVALQLAKCRGARGGGDFGPGRISRRGARCAGQLLQLPHVLPLLFGVRFGIVGGRRIQFFFCFLFGEFDVVGGAGFGGGDQGPDGEDDEDGVGYAGGGG